jgi:hypothetical protein
MTSPSTPPSEPVTKRALDVPRVVVSTATAVKLLRHFARSRVAAGLSIEHGRMKQYRDALRCLERHLWREEGLLP